MIVTLLVVILYLQESVGHTWLYKWMRYHLNNHVTVISTQLSTVIGTKKTRVVELFTYLEQWC